MPVSASEAAQVQGVDGHVGGGLPRWPGPFTGPGVLVDDHLGANQTGGMFDVGEQDQSMDDS